MLPDEARDVAVATSRPIHGAPVGGGHCPRRARDVLALPAGIYASRHGGTRARAVSNHKHSFAACTEVWYALLVEGQSLWWFFHSSPSVFSHPVPPSRRGHARQPSVQLSNPRPRWWL